MSEYMAIKDVARMMLVSERTVRRWVWAGYLTPVRIGHTVRFEKRRLLEQLDRLQTNGAPAGEDPSLG